VDSQLATYGELGDYNSARERRQQIIYGVDDGPQRLPGRFAAVLGGKIAGRPLPDQSGRDGDGLDCTFILAVETVKIVELSVGMTERVPLA